VKAMNCIHAKPEWIIENSPKRAKILSKLNISTQVMECRVATSEGTKKVYALDWDDWLSVWEYLANRGNTKATAVLKACAKESIPVRVSVTLLRVHQFCPDDVQFNDALVSSAIIWFKKNLPSPNHTVEFTYGGSFAAPNTRKFVSATVLRNTSKWTNIALNSNSRKSDLKQFQIKDLFTIKRGLATGANNFFILTKSQATTYQIPGQFLKPILPSPKYLLVDKIEADTTGSPILEPQLFLLDCDLSLSFEAGISIGFDNPL
jgi:hypothetical protein